MAPLHMKPFLTSAEISDLLRYHEKYVRQLARRGRIPAKKCGGRWLFRASDYLLPDGSLRDDIFIQPEDAA